MRRRTRRRGRCRRPAVGRRRGRRSSRPRRSAPRRRRSTPNRSALTSTPDQARRRDLRRERLLRPLLRRPTRRRPTPTARRSTRPRRHAEGQQPDDVEAARPSNPNLYQPTRLRSAQALTCDQNHNYGPEQKADERRRDGPVRPERQRRHLHGGLFGAPGLTMDYYDGNTVTGLWNYAAALRDVGQLLRHDVRPVDARRAQPDLRPDPRRSRRSTRRRGAPTTDAYAVVVAERQRRRHGHQRPGPGVRRLLGQQPHVDQQPGRADRAATSVTCSTPAGVTWGWFQGGFAPTTPYAGTGTYAVCGATHTNIGGDSSSSTTARTTTRSQYYASTSNPHHLPPTLGRGDRAHRPGQPQLRPDRLRRRRSRRATCRRSASSRRARVPGRPRRLLRPDRRAALPGQRDQRDPEVEVLEAHRDRHRLRRLRRLVRPRRPADHERLARPGQRRGDLHVGGRDSGIAGGYQDRCGPGPRLPLLVISPYVEDELRRPHADRAGLDPEVHRGQLADRPDRRRLVRPARRLDQRDVLLRPPEREVGRPDRDRRGEVGDLQLQAVQPQELLNVEHTDPDPAWIRVGVLFTGQD